MKTVAIVIARMGSTRFKGKVLADLAGNPVLNWAVTAAEFAPGVNEVWVATSTLPADDVIQQWCDENQVLVFRGSETDVLSRFAGCAREASADVVVRITGDCPFVDPQVIGQVIALREATNAHYCSNIDPPTFPDGLDCEAFTAEVLYEAEHEAQSQIDRDCVTTFISHNRARYQCETVICPIPGLHKERWVLDTYNDYDLCKEIAENAIVGDGYIGIWNFLNENPHLRSLNAHHPRNERFFEALSNEKLQPRSYEESKLTLGVALSIIPLGAQTFSKSHIQFPGKNPLFLTHGDGAYAFDVDGNRYVDLIGALLPNILGYRDQDVDTAIRRQLNSGISFSLATDLEYQLASRLKDIIPCAKMVRFGKNGTDVTSAAVRLARAYTDRSLVLSSGYHGWADCFVGGDSMRGRGVPHDVGNLTYQIKHGDSEQAILALRQEDYACVIVEPETNPEFLQVLRDVCDETGTVLIFDEVITGFRWPKMSAQAHFGITPDLATFGKAMGNGMPISALVGKKEIMKLLEPPNNIFYSGTMAGETLSLAAAIATIDKLERENVVENICHKSASLAGAVLKLFGVFATPASLEIAPGLTRISFVDSPGATKEQLGALFRQEMAANGVLIINAHALSFAHGPNEIRRIMTAYEATLATVHDTLKKGNISARLGNAALSVAADVRKAGDNW